MNLDEIPWEEPVKLMARPGVPEQYHQFDTTSAMAVRAAISACRPLLVRGEPGVGKTQLAYAAARKLKRPLVQTVVDSRTESRDLMWSFDPVRRLADAQLEATIAAIDRSPENDSEATNDSSSETVSREKALRRRIRRRLKISRYVEPGPLWWAFDWENAVGQARQCGVQPEVVPEYASIVEGVVLLIDEIDKADPDVPNGLLEALGASQFRPPGFRDPVQATASPPLVIITTNEERTLPDAFLRRCLVLQLRLPEPPAELESLLMERGRIHFPEIDGQATVFADAARIVVDDREKLKKRGQRPLPGQAEYLDLLRAVIRMTDDDAERKRLLTEIREFTLKSGVVADVELD